MGYFKGRKYIVLTQNDNGSFAVERGEFDSPAPAGTLAGELHAMGEAYVIEERDWIMRKYIIEKRRAKVTRSASHKRKMK